MNTFGREVAANSATSVILAVLSFSRNPLTTLQLHLQQGWLKPLSSPQCYHCCCALSSTRGWWGCHSKYCRCYNAAWQCSLQLLLEPFWAAVLLSLPRMALMASGIVAPAILALLLPYIYVTASMYLTLPLLLLCGLIKRSRECRACWVIPAWPTFHDSCKTPVGRRGRWGDRLYWWQSGRWQRAFVCHLTPLAQPQLSSVQTT